MRLLLSCGVFGQGERGMCVGQRRAQACAVPQRLAVRHLLTAVVSRRVVGAALPRESGEEKQAGCSRLNKRLPPGRHLGVAVTKLKKSLLRSPLRTMGRLSFPPRNKVGETSSNWLLAPSPASPCPRCDRFPTFSKFHRVSFHCS